jgi:hypothetical protein
MYAPILTYFLKIFSYPRYKMGKGFILPLQNLSSFLQ